MKKQDEIISDNELNKVTTYSDFHGITNVIGIKFTPKAKCSKCGLNEERPIERHIELPDDSTPEQVVSALERLAGVIRKDLL